MKVPVSIVATLLVLHAAHAQTQATPPPRISAPAQRVQARTVPAIPGSAVESGARVTLPADFLDADDRSIIIVGGKPVTAGSIKQQFITELRQASTPASSRVTRPPVPALPVLDNEKHLRQPIERATAVKQLPRVGRPLGDRGEAVAQPSHSYVYMLNYCKTHPAEISRVRGTVTPNGRFRIEGSCFGEKTGRVEAIGQFPGGNLGLVFESWTDSEIGAFVPPVSGAADHTIALTVVRADQSRSPAAQAQFIATRQQVAVPAGFWTPNPDFSAIEVDEDGGNIFTGYKVWGAGSPQRSTPFSLRINPACALETASWSSRSGSVDAFNGWDKPGPPNTAQVEVVWTPRCVIHTNDYVFASDSQRVCSVEFSLSASAQCPVVLTP